MQTTSNLKLWIISALIISGALIACSPIQTPLAMATATVIPSTAIATNLPSTSTIVPLASATAINLSTDIPSHIPIILETTVELDIEFTRNIMVALADYLAIPLNRVQLVSVENAEWDKDTLACPTSATFFDDPDLSAFMEENIVTGLRYVLLVGNTLYEYHTEGTEHYLHCQGEELVSGNVLVLVDPLATETLRVVRNLLANELDLSSRRIQLVDMIPVLWEDSSLGCPQPDRTYTEIEIPGYYIIVTAGNENYIYHSDSNTAYPCPSEYSSNPQN